MERVRRGGVAARDVRNAAEVEVQRTIKGTELTVFLCLFRKAVGSTMVHVDNKGIIDGLWRGEMCGNLHPMLQLTHTSHTSADVVNTSSCHSLSRTPDHPSNASSLTQDALEKVHLSCAHTRHCKMSVMVPELGCDSRERHDEMAEYTQMLSEQPAKPSVR